MNTVRQSAVAGLFYPSDADVLADDIGQYLQCAKQPSQQLSKSAPKALIVPHAGLVYSGAVAASGYLTVLANAQLISTVVLIGPAHRTYFKGLAATTMSSFRTPLGDASVDREGIARLLDHNLVIEMESAHQMEHSLEVQLPFLQTVLDSFSLIPIVVGDTNAQQVQQVLDLLWGDRKTLIIISSDLSHYHVYALAQAIDRITCSAIEQCDIDKIDGQRACGCTGINGLLLAAKQRNMTVHTLDMCNSGDVTGEKDNVVGYGCWALWEN